MDLSPMFRWYSLVASPQFAPINFWHSVAGWLGSKKRSQFHSIELQLLNSIAVRHKAQINLEFYRLQPGRDAS